MIFWNNNHIIKAGGDFVISKFSFQNFKSYRNETVFDFQASAIPEFEESLIKRDKASPLLPVSVIYGPNGGGKSALLMALGNLISIVVDPIKQLQKNTRLVLQQSVFTQPYLFDEKSRNEPTVFDLFFRTESNEFRYFLSIQENTIIDECLYRRTLGGKRTATIFERDRDTIELGASLRSKSINTEINPKMPFLSFLAINYNIPVISEAQSWFESCILINYANLLSESQIYLPTEKNQKQKFIMLLNDMGIDISDFRLDNATNNLFVSRNINKTKYEMDFVDESDGTQKLFSVLPYILFALQEGRLLIIDELDAKLHPKLLRYIISLFKNPEINKHGAQIVFTSHDLTTMNHSVFRRDEIWFAALNSSRESEIYSLYDIRNEDGTHINNTASFSKQYLEGRYGADPYLQNILNWEV